MNMNRLWNMGNPYQGAYEKVLCVCSAGLLRSPTAAVVLAGEPFNHNTRAVGISHDHALIPIDEVSVQWADSIVFMEIQHYHAAHKLYDLETLKARFYILDIPDRFAYRDPELVRMITNRWYDREIYLRVPKDEQTWPEMNDNFQ